MLPLILPIIAFIPAILYLWRLPNGRNWREWWPAIKLGLGVQLGVYVFLCILLGEKDSLPIYAVAWVAAMAAAWWLAGMDLNDAIKRRQAARARALAEDEAEAPTSEKAPAHMAVAAPQPASAPAGDRQTDGLDPLLERALGGVMLLAGVWGYYSNFLISDTGLIISAALTLVGMFVGWKRGVWRFDDFTPFTLIFPFLVLFFVLYGVGYAGGDLVARVFGSPQTVTVTTFVDETASYHRFCSRRVPLYDTPYYRVSNSFICARGSGTRGHNGATAKINFVGRSSFMGMLVDDVQLAPKSSSDQTPMPSGARTR